MSNNLHNFRRRTQLTIFKDELRIAKMRQREYYYSKDIVAHWEREVFRLTKIIDILLDHPVSKKQGKRNFGKRK